MSQPKHTAQAQHYNWAEILPEEMSRSLTRQYVSGDQAMVARIVLKKGCVVATHHHPNEQIACILSGALEFRVREQTHIVRAGELLIIPAGVPHSAVALEDTVDLDIFAPPRTDWLMNDDSYLRHEQDKLQGNAGDM